MGSSLSIIIALWDSFVKLKMGQAKIALFYNVKQQSEA
jgi:hypothetical protein